MSDVDVLENDPMQPWNEGKPQTKPLPRLPDWVAGALYRKKDDDEFSDGFRYWVPKPSLHSWQTIGFIIVNLATAVGLCSFAILGFAFVYLGDMSDNLKWGLIFSGSVSLALGSEIGTLVTVVEIFRKMKANSRPLLARVLISILTTVRAVRVVIDALTMLYKEPVDKAFDKAVKMIDRTLKKEDRGTSVWDWIGLVISMCTSLSGVALAQVSVMELLGVDMSYEWFAVVRQWSPVALALFGVLDGYVNHWEFGMHQARIDEAVMEWYKKRENAKREIEKRYLS